MRCRGPGPPEDEEDEDNDDDEDEDEDDGDGGGGDEEDADDDHLVEHLEHQVDRLFPGSRLGLRFLGGFAEVQRQALHAVMCSHTVHAYISTTRCAVPRMAR